MREKRVIPVLIQDHTDILVYPRSFSLKNLTISASLAVLFCAFSNSSPAQTSALSTAAPWQLRQGHGVTTKKPAPAPIATANNMELPKSFWVATNLTPEQTKKEAENAPALKIAYYSQLALNEDTPQKKAERKTHAKTATITAREQKPSRIAQAQTGVKKSSSPSYKTTVAKADTVKPIPAPAGTRVMGFLDDDTPAKPYPTKHVSEQRVATRQKTVTAENQSHDKINTLPWLKNAPAHNQIAAAEIKSVKMEALNSSEASVVPQDKTMPLPQPLLLPASSQSSEMQPTSGLGISAQSESILHKLPPEKPRKMEKLDPINMKHMQKNALEEDAEVKKHNGIGIEMSIKQPKANITKLLDDAYNQLLAGDQEGAVQSYQQVLAVQPNNKLALFGLATTYHRAGLIKMARPLYGKLLAIDPQNVEGLNNFLVLLADEDPQEAVKELEKLQVQHPTFSPIPAQIAIIFEKTGDYDNAFSYMNKAISLSPENMKYRYNMAVILDKKHDWAGASELYRQLLLANDRGEKIPATADEIQHRLLYIESNSTAK